MKDDVPVFTPQDFLQYVASVRDVNLETFRIPPRMVMVYNRRHLDFINELIDGKPCEWWWYGDRLRMYMGASTMQE